MFVTIKSKLKKIKVKIQNKVTKKVNYSHENYINTDL